jgi:hypothetical protein
MFKAKKAPAAQVVKEPVEPPKSPAMIEAEKAIARGERIKKLSDEAEMWRKFAGGCKPGRSLFEDIGLLLYACAPFPQRLRTSMDEDSAPLWAAFANQMADERERRLKDVLGC